MGIGVYFALPAEPGVLAWALIGAGFAAGVAGAVLGLRRYPLYLALVFALAGLLLGGLRTHLVAGPVLDFRYYGPVEGRVVAVDRSASDKPRLTLDRVVLERVSPDETPNRVRLSLHGDQRWLDPAPGMIVIVTGFLSAPEGPVEPGGFDFRRMAWFDRLGAVGYARSPALLLEPAGRGLPIGRMRLAIAEAVRAALPGEVGAFAAAITTGDRSGIGAQTMADLRASNLAHLLAISGLHMGLLTGFVFTAIRRALVLFPGLALEWPVKSWAALGALGAGAFYLALSGGNVATQRAFIMVSVMLVAVLLNRRALTLRAVALAALVVLVLRPEALTEPGFQMSFSATLGLVAVFRLIRDHRTRRLPKWAAPVMATLVSSAVAGFATAPFSAAHFNQVSQYGLIANVVSVPLMGVIVMPAAVLAALLAPFGLGWIGLEIMASAIRWILFVAHWIATRENAVTLVPSPPGMVLAGIALGGLWLILWQGRGRLAGAVPVAAALWLWEVAERPDILVAPSGGLVGAMAGEARILSKPRGDGFAARSWLENDGAVADQALAAGNLAALLPEGFDHITGRGALERARAACRPGRMVIVNQVLDEVLQGCTLLGPRDLERTGALAIHFDDAGPRITTARQVSGERAWMAHLPPPATVEWPTAAPDALLAARNAR